MIDLKSIARDLYETAQIKKKADLDRKAPRDELDVYFTSLMREDDHKIPTDSIEIPREFCVRTNLTQKDFFESRFPGWRIVAHEVNIERASDTFILMREAYLIPHKEIVEYDNKNDIQIERQVVNGNPSIDWDTLRAERPELFERLAEPIIEYKLNEMELQAIYQEDPTILTLLRRHTVLPEPTTKIVPRLVKKNED